MTKRLGDVNLLLLVFHRKYFALKPVTSRFESVLAAALCEDRHPAVRALLGPISHGQLRARLKALRPKIENPSWEVLNFAHAAAEKAGLPCRPMPDAIPGVRRRTRTGQQFERVKRNMPVVHALRQMTPLQLDLVRRFRSLPPEEFATLIRRLKA